MFQFCQFIGIDTGTQYVRQFLPYQTFCRLGFLSAFISLYVWNSHSAANGFTIDKRKSTGQRSFI